MLLSVFSILHARCRTVGSIWFGVKLSRIKRVNLSSGERVFFVGMKSSGPNFAAVGKETAGHTSDCNALRVAFFTACVCGALIVVSGVFMHLHLDKRVMLTTISVFGDWVGLRRVFMEATSYDPRFNLPALEYYPAFESGVSNLLVVQDLFDRGLISSEVFVNASRLFNQTSGLRLVELVSFNQLQQLADAFFSKFLYTVVGTPLPSSFSTQSSFGSHDPRILSRLMRVSGCSFPDAVPGTSPWDRSPGCLCIAKAYLSFINSTVRMAGNVTSAAREAAAADTLRCLDRRVTWHAWVAGKDWSVHPAALALYCNCVLFLVSVTFVLVYYVAQGTGHPVRRLWMVKGVLLLLTFGLSVFFWVHDTMANIFLLVGLFLTFGTLTMGAQSVLGYYVETRGARVADRGAPHPLLVCFWLNVPHILPALLVSVAIGGYIRDVYAVWAVTFIGAVMGSLLQV